jgi:transcriptional regulator with XRE-family HTH domain
MARSRPDQAILSAFGTYIRKLRKGRGWTQLILAEHAGLSRTYIGGIERGERNLAIVNVNKLSLALGDNFSAFFPYNAKPARRRSPRLRVVR